MARTCRHCGREVPEVGVLFCPFCNIDRQHPHLRRSKWIVLLGPLYFLFFAVAWGTYQRRLGI